MQEMVWLLLVIGLFSTTVGSVQDLAFTESLYETSINETSFDPSLALEPSFLTVLCEYSTANNTNTTSGNIMYTLMADEDIPFAIDLTTGELSITDELDYETVTQYSFTAVCIQIGDLDLNDSTTIVINILPVNEHRPTIITILTHTIITETTQPGLLQTTLPGTAYIVSDRDQPPDPIYYTVRESGDGLGIVFNETLDGVVLMEPYDRESQNSTDCNTIQQRIFRVTICDVNPPDENCPNVLLTISFFPSNDNTPQFSQDQYQATIPENLAENSTLDVVVSCTDDDICEGEFGGMNITDPDMASMFAIDSNGSIISLQPQDYEQTRSYALNITCFDRGIPRAQRRAFTVVHINITDENDNLPVCSEPEPVNIKAGSYELVSLLQLTCSDEDEGLNGLLTFDVEEDLPHVPKGEFRLNQATGELQFLGELESTAEFNFRIVVSDSGATPLTTTVPVTVKVSKASVTNPESSDEPVMFPLVILIAVCVLGGLLLICMLILLCCCCCYCCCYKRKRKAKKLPVKVLDLKSENVVSNNPAIKMKEYTLAYETTSAPSDSNLQTLLDQPSSSFTTEDTTGDYVISNVAVAVEEDKDPLGLVEQIGLELDQMDLENSNCDEELQGHNETLTAESTHEDTQKDSIPGSASGSANPTTDTQDASTTNLQDGPFADLKNGPIADPQDGPHKSHDRDVVDSSTKQEATSRPQNDDTINSVQLEITNM